MSALSALIRATNPAAGRLISAAIVAAHLEPYRRPVIHLAALAVFLLSTAVIFYRLGDRDLWSSHEARAAQDATSVLEGKWLIPRLFDGRLELQKPPLYYWLIALWCRATGRPVDELAVRLPAALSACLIVLTLLAIGYIESRPIVGVLAASLLLLMPHFLWQTHVGRVDMPLTATLTLAYAFWIRYLRCTCHCAAKYLALIACSLAMVAGILLKGPLAAILFGLVIFSNALLSMYLCSKTNVWHYAKLQLTTQRPAAASILIVLLAITPALLWYIAANEYTQGQWVREFIFRHNLARGLGGDAQLDRHSHWLGPAYYLIRLPLYLGPIVLLLPWCVRRLSQYIREDNCTRFSFCWWIAPLVFFSLMRYKRMDYLLVAYPGIALFLSSILVRYWDNFSTNLQRRYLLIGLTSVLVVSIIWFAYLSLIVPIVDSAQQQRDFARLVRNYAFQGPVIMYNTEAHLLSYRVGKPVCRTFDVKQLEQWLDQIVVAYVIVRQRDLEEFGQNLGPERTWEILGVNKQLRKFSQSAWFPFDDQEPLILVRVVTPIKA